MVLVSRTEAKLVEAEAELRSKYNVKARCAALFVLCCNGAQRGAECPRERALPAHAQHFIPVAPPIYARSKFSQNLSPADMHPACRPSTACWTCAAHLTPTMRSWGRRWRGLTLGSW